jgi:hypothetical protein
MKENCKQEERAAAVPPRAAANHGPQFVFVIAYWGIKGNEKSGSCSTAGSYGKLIRNVSQKS